MLSWIDCPRIRQQLVRLLLNSNAIRNAHLALEGKILTSTLIRVNMAGAPKRRNNPSIQ